MFLFIITGAHWLLVPSVLAVGIWPLVCVFGVCMLSLYLFPLATLDYFSPKTCTVSCFFFFLFQNLLVVEVCVQYVPVI